MSPVDLRDELNKIIEAEDVELDCPINFCVDDEVYEVQSLQINIMADEVAPLRINLR